MDTIRRAKKWNFFICQNMIFDLELSEHAKITYLYLSRCADDEGNSFPSYKTIGEKCSFSRSTSIKAIKELKNIGLLTSEKRVIHLDNKVRNTSNLYTLYDEPITGIEESVKKNSPSCSPTPPPSVGDTPPLVQEIHHPSVGDTPYKYPYINTHYINTQSIYPNTPNKHITNFSGDDRQIEYNNAKELFSKKLDFTTLRNEYNNDEKIDEIELNILEMFFLPSLKVNGQVIIQELVRSALMKLTYYHIIDLMRKYDTITTEIRHPKAFIQSMIYNIAFESSLAISNNVNVNQSIYKSNLSTSNSISRL